MNIRRANESDAIALAQMAEDSFRDTFASENSPSDMELHCKNNFSPEIQQQEILDQNMATLLAENNGQLVGYVQIRLLSHSDIISAVHPTELYRLYVSSEWHGRGLADKLMAEVFAIAAKTQSDCIWLGVWEYNPRAIAYYTKHDFDIVGEHQFKLGNDLQRDIIMLTKLKD